MDASRENETSADNTTLSATTVTVRHQSNDMNASVTCQNTNILDNSTNSCDNVIVECEKGELNVNVPANACTLAESMTKSDDAENQANGASKDKTVARVTDNVGSDPQSQSVSKTLPDVTSEPDDPINVFETLKDRLDSLRSDLEEFMSTPIVPMTDDSTAMDCHELAVSLNNDLNYVVDSVTSTVFPLDILQNNVKNSALNQLASYGSSDSDNSSDSEDSDADDCPIISTDGHINFRNKNVEDMYETGDSSSESDTDTDESIALMGDKKSSKKPNNVTEADKVVRTKGELQLCDLPPIDSLYISVPEQECEELGFVMSIVEELVVVQALPNMPPLDIDSVLFLNKGAKTLGKIFDVLGPVNEPCYAIRFNSKEDIIAKEITTQMKVYCAPRTEHTSYVLVCDLMKVKGCDASWKEDNEPPANCLDFSDDEQERVSKVKRKASRSKQMQENGTSEFEKRKNQRNLQLNAHFNRQQQSSAFLRSSSQHQHSQPPQLHLQRPPLTPQAHHSWHTQGPPAPRQWYNPVAGPSYNQHHTHHHHPPPPPTGSSNFYGNHSQAFCPPDPFFFRNPIFQQPHHYAAAAAGVATPPPFVYPRFSSLPPPVPPPLLAPPNAMEDYTPLNLNTPPSLFSRAPSQPSTALTRNIPGSPFPPPPPNF